MKKSEYKSIAEKFKSLTNNREELLNKDIEEICIYLCDEDGSLTDDELDKAERVVIAYKPYSCTKDTYEVELYVRGIIKQCVSPADYARVEEWDDDGWFHSEFCLDGE